jgi:hypothetical protein
MLDDKLWILNYLKSFTNLFVIELCCFVTNVFLVMGNNSTHFFQVFPSIRQAAIRHRCLRKQPHQLNKEKRSITDHG